MCFPVAPVLLLSRTATPSTKWQSPVPLQQELNTCAVGRLPPNDVPLEPTATDIESDEDELSGEEEFLLIQMEADDSADYITPEDTPAHLQEDWNDSDGLAIATAGPASPFEPTGQAPLS